MPSGAHKWWRINVLAQTPGNALALSTIEYRASVGGADQAFGSGGVATASSTYSIFVASRCFDNDHNTLWSALNAVTPTVPQWVTFEFPAPVAIDQVAIAARNDSTVVGGNARDFNVEWSDDGVTFTIEWVERGYTTWGNSEVKLFNRPTTLRATKLPAYAVTGPLPVRVRAHKVLSYGVLGTGTPGLVGATKIVAYGVLQMVAALRATKINAYLVTRETPFEEYGGDLVPCGYAERPENEFALCATRPDTVLEACGERPDQDTLYPCQPYPRH